MIRAKKQAALNLQVIEAQGFYASEVLSVTPIRTVDGGDRHIVRLLLPVSADFYGASRPVWEFSSDVLGGGGGVGLDGVFIPTTTTKVRYNPDINNGIVEVLNGTVWTNIAGGSNVRVAFIGVDKNIYIKVTDGTYYYASYTNLTAWPATSQASYDIQTTGLGSIRL